MKKLFLILLLFVALGGALYFAVPKLVDRPYGKGGIVNIPKGASVAKMAEILAEHDIIYSARSFRYLARYRGQDKRLKYGEYEFAPAIKPSAVMEKLARGQRLVRRFTIPEGYRFSQIVQVLADAGLGSPAELNAFFRDPTLLAQTVPGAISLEGYLFPSTYEYTRDMTGREILMKMIAAFNQNFSIAWRERALQAGWSLAQVVTLASIVEKETAQPTERPLIAAVFHNRLQRGMPLQTDPTVIYGLANYDGNIRKTDLQNPHLYNTYVHAGLPPGPIASPGRASLEAVIFPESTEYLFFVSKGNGTHYFSKSLEEHNAAVRQYQLKQ